MGFDVLVSAPFRAGGKVDEVVKNVPQVGMGLGYPRASWRVKCCYCAVTV